MTHLKIFLADFCSLFTYDKTLNQSYVSLHRDYAQILISFRKHLCEVFKS